VKQQAPRLLIGAVASNSGKTTFTCGLLRAFKRRGIQPAACKCGPDYIDPMFHRTVIEAESRNLDLFFSSEEDIVRLIAKGAAHNDITVIEGVMGYYDGIAVSDTASAWDVARTTETPSVLVIDGRGRARSIAAEVAGFAQFRAQSQVCGVIFNRIAPMLYPQLKALVEEETGVRVFGYLPALDGAGLESRHLGLVTAGEVHDLQARLDVIADAIEQSVDIEGLLELAHTASDIEYEPRVLPAVVSAEDDAPVIAVARDDAFCFYYDDALDTLEELGARLVWFSPLVDDALPAQANGLYLGGGYPELHARALSENVSMRESIARAIADGLPTIAECGGFMYLHDAIEDEAGVSWPMAGVVKGSSYKTDRLRRFGYITLAAQENGLLADAGQTMQAHEFHYWDSTDAGSAFHASKPQSARAWECGINTCSLYAGYPHLYLYSEPQAAARFVRSCACYAQGGSFRGACA
jgi:cobyrinic acid a,c-diamide synthase